jgi:hypothetical protein
MMSSATAGDLLVDKARQVLCDEIARCVRMKRFSVKVRIAETEGQPAEAWFYSHGKRGWQMESEPITDRPLVNAMNETLEMLASKEHHDQWSARRQSRADGHDIELRFRPEHLEDRLGDKLALALMGVLFRDQHDSRKDSRRNIRTPRPKRQQS